LKVLEERYVEEPGKTLDDYFRRMDDDHHH
jgi:hypothetical protein